MACISLYFASCDSGSSEKIELTKLRRKISLIAHRGASDAAPENTLAAIKKALQGPADYIEVDVHQTKDGEVILMHDATVNRTTDGHGAIAKLTLAEIKKLDAGLWYDSAYRHEKVPTLAETLQLVRGRKKLLIEIKKGRDGFYKGLEHKILTIIRENKAQNWCILQTFYDPVLENIWKNELAVPTHKLIVAKIPFLPLYFDHRIRWGSFDKYDRAIAINANQYFTTQGFVKELHNNGFKTYPWTVDDPQAINRVLALGADGVITNTISHLEIE
ncbi:glycerophosphoryl diester phosphodiesterase [Adhaeribacter aerolatus]|uniref:Glycerophosphoryl diester phosphodiesterase n=2 Tax=Adhaeribacter aerolatus TaxID=670289 RepID=A0A512B2L8_9BACT|nr:glycerophosphoryl diester phosphodiesterase [Adhaeribacter aerolatus]